MWNTSIGTLDLMIAARARKNGKPFKRQLLPHEQEAKEQGQALAKRLQEARARGSH